MKAPKKPSPPNNAPMTTKIKNNIAKPTMCFP